MLNPHAISSHETPAHFKSRMTSQLSHPHMSNLLSCDFVDMARRTATLPCSSIAIDDSRSGAPEASPLSQNKKGPKWEYNSTMPKFNIASGSPPTSLSPPTILFANAICKPDGDPVVRHFDPLRCVVLCHAVSPDVVRVPLPYGDRCNVMYLRCTSCSLAYCTI